MKAHDIAPETGDYEGASSPPRKLISLGTPGPVRDEAMQIDTDALLEALEGLNAKQTAAFMLLAIHMHRTDDRTFLDDPSTVARLLKCSKIAWLTRLKPAVMPLLDRVGGDE